MQFPELIRSLKLTPQGKKELDDLLELPSVRAALDDSETHLLAERKELADDLATVHSRHEKSITAAGKAARAAETALQEAEDARVRALQACNHARQQAYAAVMSAETEAANLRRKLQEGRDMRLDDAYIHLANLGEAARGLLHVQPVVTRRTFGSKETAYVSNGHDVEVARKALADALAEVESMTTAALGRRDITKRLIDLFESLRKPLAPLELNPPRLEHGEVLEPLRWNGVADLKDRINAAAA